MPTRATSLHLVEDDVPLQRFLTYRLSQLGSRLNRQAIDLLKRETGLKLPEWRVIALLAANRRLNAARLEELSGIDRGLLSRTFRSLESRGLIKADRSPDDRREVYATLTPAGRQLHRRQLPVMQARQRHLLSCLTAEERRVVFGIVEKLIAAADDRNFGDATE